MGWGVAEDERAEGGIDYMLDGGLHAHIAYLYPLSTTYTSYFTLPFILFC